MADKAKHVKVAEAKARGAGRPAHEPTPVLRGVVSGLKMKGISNEAIAKELRLGRLALEKHYKDEHSEPKTHPLGLVFEVYMMNLEKGSVPAAD